MLQSLYLPPEEFWDQHCFSGECTRAADWSRKTTCLVLCERHIRLQGPTFWEWRERRLDHIRLQRGCKLPAFAVHLGSQRAVRVQNPSFCNSLACISRPGTGCKFEMSTVKKRKSKTIKVSRTPVPTEERRFTNFAARADGSVPSNDFRIKLVLDIVQTAWKAAVPVAVAC